MNHSINKISEQLLKIWEYIINDGYLYLSYHLFLYISICVCVAWQKGPLNYSNWIKRNLYLLIGLSVATLKPPQENVSLKSWCRLLTLFTSWLSSSQLTPGVSPSWLCSAHCQALPLVSGFQWQLSTGGLVWVSWLVVISLWAGLLSVQVVYISCPL